MHQLRHADVGPFVRLFGMVSDLRCVIKDAQHRYVYVNDAWLRCFGYADASEVLGRTALELFPKWRASRYIEEEKQILEQGILFDYEELSLNSDGTPERWRTIKAPWMRGGEIRGVTNVSVYIASPRSLESRTDEIPEIVVEFARRACEGATISDIAAEFGMSRRTFERRFRRAMQETPQQLRMRCKIAKAKQLLSSTQPLAAVARVCGFSDQSHFAKNFTKHVGVSPSKFRKAVSESGGSNILAVHRHTNAMVWPDTP